MSIEQSERTASRNTAPASLNASAVQARTASAAYRRYRQGVLDGTVQRQADPSRHLDQRGLARGSWNRLSP